MITPSFGLTATERVLPRLALDWTTGLAQTGVDVARAGVATFVGSNGLIQSATENTQRIDYSTGTPGLLVEESRTNLATASEDLTDTGAWASLSEQTITANQATAPDGTLTADRVDVGVAGVSSRTFQTVTSVTGTTYTASFWLWADEGEAASVNLQIVNTSNTTLGTLIAVLSTTPTRFFVSGVADSTSIRIQLRARQSDKSFYAWGAQLEAGAFPTSYIPTEATAVTRNADVATMTGTNFSDWFNVNAGTFFIETNARNGDDLLTAGSYVLTADATALKKYATTYGSDPSATQLDFGKGTIQKVMYYPQELIAAELAALTA